MHLLESGSVDARRWDELGLPQYFVLQGMLQFITNKPSLIKRNVPKSGKPMGFHAV